MVSSETSNDRFPRQQDLVPAERLAELAVTVIGVSAIGRQVALQLAAIGVRRLQVVDFDRVDETNITTQGYWLADIGRLKVLATSEAIDQFDPIVEVAIVGDRYRPKLQMGSVVFRCVDSTDARSAIWWSAGHRTEFWADGRMLGEAIRILVSADAPSRRHYPTTLFASTDA